MTPEGWRELQLKDVIKLASGDGRPSDVVANPDDQRTNPVYGGNGILGFTGEANSHADDIIIGRVGEYCGITRFVPGAKWITDNALYVKSIEAGFDRRFLALKLQHYDLSRLRAKGGQPLISQKPIYGLRFGFPPEGEQKAIRIAVKTWDRAIETVESLIANACAQKQALMQQLLPQGTTPPKNRLPGFSGEWRETTIEGAASVLVSNVDKKSVKGERPVRLCNYMDVYGRDQIEADMDFMVATATEAQIRKFGLKVGDVIITKDSETPDDIAIPTIIQTTAPDLVCGYHLAILRPKDGTDGQFLKFFFEHPRTRHFFASRANGATRFGLTVGAIETAPISLPSHAEQREIGNVILAAETEIHRLNPILTALRQEKAALMQQLLTGKRRVKLAESEVA